VEVGPDEGRPVVVHFLDEPGRRLAVHPVLAHHPLDPLFDGRREAHPQHVGHPLEEEIGAPAHEDDAVVHGALVDVGVHEGHEAPIFPVEAVPKGRPVLVDLVEQRDPALPLRPQVGEDPFLPHVVVSHPLRHGGADLLSAASVFPGYGEDGHGVAFLWLVSRGRMKGSRRSGEARHFLDETL
jgi:hypothetical protein